MLLQMILLGTLWAIAAPVTAGELKVFAKGVRYGLTYDEQGITLDGRGYRLNVNRTRCNHEVIRRFNSRLKKLLTGASHQSSFSQKSSPPPHYYVVDGIRYTTDFKSKETRPLLSIPEEVRRVKLQNKYLCHPSSD